MKCVCPYTVSNLYFISHLSDLTILYTISNKLIKYHTFSLSL